MSYRLEPSTSVLTVSRAVKCFFLCPSSIFLFFTLTVSYFSVESDHSHGSPPSRVAVLSPGFQRRYSELNAEQNKQVKQINKGVTLEG